MKVDDQDLKPVHDKLVLLDMDGTGVNFMKRALDVYNMRHAARVGTAYKEEEVVHYFFEDWLAPEEAAAMNAIFNEPGFFASLEPYPEALDVVQRLVRLCRVEVCSSPPTTIINNKRVLNPNVAAEKIGWLLRHWPDVADDVTLTRKKHNYHADAIVDDSASTVVKWCKRHKDGVGVVVARPWNKDAVSSALEHGVDNITRVDLQSVPDVLDRFFRSMTS